MVIIGEELLNDTFNHRRKEKSHPTIQKKIRENSCRVLWSPWGAGTARCHSSHSTPVISAAFSVPNFICASSREAEERVSLRGRVRGAGGDSRWHCSPRNEPRSHPTLPILHPHTLPCPLFPLYPSSLSGTETSLALRRASPTLVVSLTKSSRIWDVISSPCQSRVSKQILCTVRFWCRGESWSSLILALAALFGMQEAEHACCLCTGKAGGGKQSLKSR